MRTHVDAQGVSHIQCPKCGLSLFELLPLGIPGTGTSVCLNCRTSIASWAHGPQPDRSFISR